MTIPAHHFFPSADPARDPSLVEGDARVVTHEGRSGLQLRSVHARLAIPVDLNALPRGSVSFWFLPLEELSFRHPCADKRKAHPGVDANNHILLGDHPDLENVFDSRFAIAWDPGFYPQLFAKFCPGYVYHHCFRPERKLHVLAGHFAFPRLRWHQLVLTWDKPDGRCSLYVNGVLVSTSPTDAPLVADACGPRLYSGSTAFAVGDFVFHDRALSAQEIASAFSAELPAPDPDYQRSLRETYAGENPRPFTFAPDASWREELALPLNRPEDLRAFYVQGKTDAPSITPEGLLVVTGRQSAPPHPAPDHEQVYLWTERDFEGDLSVSYEFKALERGGLSLFLGRASGMHGEDFMSDYPRRTTGSMSMVCWENIRNYHWEYYREMSDCRMDVATSALIKNPWTFPLAYRCADAPLELGVWHRLQFLHVGRRLTGAIDGVVVFDVEDDGAAGHGPVYRHGRFAIRCMWRTKMLFRDLRVHARPPDYVIPPLPSVAAAR